MSFTKFPYKTVWDRWKAASMHAKASGFDTMPACDGRTDGRTDGHMMTANTALAWRRAVK